MNQINSFQSVTDFELISVNCRIVFDKITISQ
uniref:Uncharacterized protein n=1 Tax=Myoviridae sp. ctKkB1 TaxID=2825081 RepID=A0A8S5V4G6_9CAUD|nr:MAG TPA: hypothetical protein [Myoviridae sp. ctKkB1]